MQEIPQLLPPHKAVEGQQHGDVQLCRLLQHRLYLRAVFAHDIGVVAPGLVQIIPVEVHLIGKQPAIQGPEAAEGIRRQQQTIRLIIGHQYLRPVDHRSRNKAQRVPPGAEGIPLLHHMDALLKAGAEELGHHGLGHSAAIDLHLREAQHQLLQLRRVIRLHVVYHHVVQRPPLQRMEEIFPEGAAHRRIRRVKQYGLFIPQQIAVEGDAVGYVEHTLKHGQPPPVGAYPRVIVIYLSRAVHGKTPFVLICSRCSIVYQIFPPFATGKSTPHMRRAF